jgi:hypothetical protein
MLHATHKIKLLMACWQVAWRLLAQFGRAPGPIEHFRLAIAAADLEAHIIDYGQRMEAAYARYCASGCPADRRDADRLRLDMEAAIRQRAPQTVRRMEVERGLA